MVHICRIKWNHTTKDSNSLLKFYLAVFCRRQEVGLGMRLEGESLVLCLRLPGLESVLRVSRELHGLAGPRDTTGLWTRWCGSFVRFHSPPTAPVLSKYSALSLSVISLLNPPNVCTDWGTHCSAKALLAAAEFSMNRCPQSRARLFTS